MFKTLLIKEWKEKAVIGVFGLGLMAAFLTAFLVFGGDRDLRELIPGGFLLIFFPFVGLMLGASAFESEFRNGSWAYLLSRPVRKETIWLAKLVALLSIMAGLWLVFLGLLAVVPGLAEVIAGFRLPATVGESGLLFLPLVLLTSFLFFSVAFSLSLLADRQFSVVFGSFFIGFALQGLLSYLALLAARRGYFYYLISNGRLPWTDSYKLALVLTCLAFFAASLLTFRKVDFSQPRNKAVSLAKYSLVFLVLSWSLAAVWPAVRPGPKEEINSGIDVMGGKAFFSTTRGLYRYDIVGDELEKIAGWRSRYPSYIVGGGKIIYESRQGIGARSGLRVMNADGTGKALLAEDEQDEPSFDWPYQGIILSPDGKTAVVIAPDLEGKSFTSYKRALWSIRTDGTGSKELPPLETALTGTAYSWLRIDSWLSSPDRLLLMSRPQGAAPGSLWTYNLATGAQARLFEGPRLGRCSVSPGSDAALIVHAPEVKGPIGLSLLDLASGGMAPVMTVDNAAGSIWFSIMEIVWNRKGDRAAFLIQKSPGIFTPAVYLLSERRVIMPEDVLLEGAQNLWPSLAWIGDERLVAGSSKEHSMKILDNGLAIERTIPVPDLIAGAFALCAVGDVVLLQNFGDGPASPPVSNWRLDLKTGKWKRIR